jgi:hypothetical protein
MYSILLLFFVSDAPVLYRAQVSSFGCTSRAEVSQLQKVRAHPEAFQKLLFTQAAYGQCIAIAKGAVVEGSVEQADTTLLRINEQRDPPGYMAPSSDFKAVKREGKR